jgi:hypothetical protein
MSEPIDACSDSAPPDGDSGRARRDPRCTSRGPPNAARYASRLGSTSRLAALRWGVEPLVALYLPDRGWVSSSVGLVLRVNGPPQLSPSRRRAHQHASTKCACWWAPDPLLFFGSLPSACGQVSAQHWQPCHGSWDLSHPPGACWARGAGWVGLGRNRRFASIGAGAFRDRFWNRCRVGIGPINRFACRAAASSRALALNRARKPYGGWTSVFQSEFGLPRRCKATSVDVH